MCQDIFQLQKILTENEVCIANYTFPNKDMIVKRLKQKYPQSEHFIFSDFVQIDDMKYKTNDITVSFILKYKTLIILNDGVSIVEEVHDMFPIIVKGNHIEEHLNLMSKENVRRMISDSFFKTKQNQNNAMVEYFINTNKENLLLDCIKLKNIDHKDINVIWHKLVSEKLNLVKQLNFTSCDIFNPYENKINTFEVKPQNNIFVNTKKLFECVNKIDYWIARINYTSLLGDKRDFLEYSLSN